MSKLNLILAGATLALASAGVLAQGASMPRVDQREGNQQARIAQGAASGALTPHETQRLEKQQAHVANAETKAEADGVVTKSERRKLHRMQNRANSDIYSQKHDAQVAKP